MVMWCPFALNAQVNQGNCPVNIDFELGDFTNWTAFIGSASNAAAMTTTPPVNNRHTILNRATSTGINDLYGGFPVLCPDGSGYTVKLGNNSTGNQAERLRYRFTVPSVSGQYSMVLYYAVVFQNPNHSAAQQPKFDVKVYDFVTGGEVGCSSYSFVATSSLPGFQTSPQGAGILYRDWTPLTIDLSTSIGKDVVVEFTTFDCTPGGHFGYAYVDVGANCISSLQGYTYCTNADSVKLTAPFGYQAYSWWNANYTTNYGTATTLTLAPPPPVGTVINLDVTPFIGYGCRDTLSVSLVSEMPPTIPIIDSLYSFCINQAPPILNATVLPGYIQRWYTTPTGGTPLPGPPIINTGVSGSTFYWVAQQSFGGCEGPRKMVEIRIIPKPFGQFTINNTIQCASSNSYVVTVTPGTLNPSYTYNWNFGNGIGTGSGASFAYTYPTAGNYNIKLISSEGSCADSTTLPVQVISSPIASFTVQDACEGDTLTIINNSFTGNGSFYTWNFGNGVTSNLINPRAVLNTIGVNNINLRIDLGTCFDDTTVQVTIFEKPKPNFSTNIICTKDSAQFFDNSIMNTGTIDTWNWDFGGGLTSNVPNPIIKINNFGVNNIKLTVKSGLCSKDTTKAITIFEKPIANIFRQDTACLGQAFTIKDQSFFTSGASASGINNWWWQLANGSTVNTQNINQLCTQVVTNFKFAVTAVNGCKSDTLDFAVNAIAPITPQFAVLTPFCELRDIIIEDQTPNVYSRIWRIDGIQVDTSRIFKVNNLLPSVRNISLINLDSFGCRSLIKDTLVTIRKRPAFIYTYSDSCVEKPISFAAVDVDAFNIREWLWTFEGSTKLGNANTIHQFAKHGAQKISLHGKDAFGCVSDTVEKIIKINYNPVKAGIDLLAMATQPVQLTAVIDVPATFVWMPSTGLNNANVQSPTATNSADQLYKVRATSVYGCESFDDIKISVYKGPDVYIPNIFTPNNDGINDVLKITPVGITKVEYFRIFNRLGNKVFETTNASLAWDGIFRGKFAASGAYVYTLSAVDYLGNKVAKKGTIVLQR